MSRPAVPRTHRRVRRRSLSVRPSRRRRALFGAWLGGPGRGTARWMASST